MRHLTWRTPTQPLQWLGETLTRPLLTRPLGWWRLSRVPYTGWRVAGPSGWQNMLWQPSVIRCQAGRSATAVIKRIENGQINKFPKCRACELTLNFPCWSVGVRAEKVVGLQEALISQPFGVRETRTVRVIAAGV